MDAVILAFLKEGYLPVIKPAMASGVQLHLLDRKMERLLLAITLFKKTGKIHTDGNYFCCWSVKVYLLHTCYPCRQH